MEHPYLPTHLDDTDEGAAFNPDRLDVILRDLAEDLRTDALDTEDSVSIREAIDRLRDDLRAEAED